MPVKITNPVLQSRDSQRSFDYPLAALVGIFPLLFLGQVLLWVHFLPGAARGSADFRHLYVAGYMVRTGHGHELHNYQAQKAFQARLVSAAEPALPFIRPAYQALLFVPFSHLSYRAAYLAFLALNFLLLGAFWLVLRPVLTVLASKPWLPLALMLSFLPASVALLQGQDSLVLLTLLACAATCESRGRDFTAGASLALGLFKLQIVLPVFLLFLFWRRWRFAAGFAAVASLLSLLSVYIVGLEQARAFLHSLWSVGGSGSQAAALDFRLRVALMANLRGLLAGFAGSKLSSPGTQSLIMVLSLAVLLTVVLLTRKSASSAQTVGLATTFSAVVSYYLFVHDLSVLLLPVLAVFNRSLASRGRQTPWDRLEASLAVLIVVAPVFLFVSPAHFYLASLPIIAFLAVMVLRVNAESRSSLSALLDEHRNSL